MRKYFVLGFLVAALLPSVNVFAQDANVYIVNKTSPFSIYQNGKKLTKVPAQKSTTEKTQFIMLDCGLNIYSYLVDQKSKKVNIYRNGQILKTSGYSTPPNIISADKEGNWSGLATVGGKSWVIKNGQQIKAIDLMANETIVYISVSGDVYSEINNVKDKTVEVRINGKKHKSVAIPAADEMMVRIWLLNSNGTDYFTYIKQAKMFPDQATDRIGNSNTKTSSNPCGKNYVRDQQCVEQAAGNDAAIAKCPCKEASSYEGAMGELCEN